MLAFDSGRLPPTLPLLGFWSGGGSPFRLVLFREVCLVLLPPPLGSAFGRSSRTFGGDEEIRPQTLFFLTLVFFTDSESLPFFSLADYPLTGPSDPPQTSFAYLRRPAFSGFFGVCAPLWFFSIPGAIPCVIGERPRL